VTRDTKRLAKLTKPRIQGILPRQRLFDLLDRQREHPVVWVVGPPGAGKTALVATYLEASGLSALWYEVDNGDADPASFFYYLQLATARVAADKREPLPLLTPEYLADLPGFARRFFQNFYGRLTNPSVLVLDNYQEVPSESSFHTVIAQALSRAPEAINVIVISRAAPPAQCLRHVANGVIATIDFQDLRLTFAETSEIASAKQKLNEETLRALHTQADGWAAGTMLMLERLKRTGALNFVSHVETMDTVFNYFAGHVFDDLPSSARDVLIRTSLLPHVTVRMAKAISGNPDAGKVLDELYRRHLFTNRRTGEELTYHYHALFQAFLQAQARRLLSPDEYIRLHNRAASLLKADGKTEYALALYLERSAWNQAEELILQLASTLIRQGRRQTLGDWIAALPSDHVETAPWLQFWQGACIAATEPKEGRRTLERAHRGFVEQQDRLGQTLATAAIIETYVFDFEFESAGEWIVALETLLADPPDFPSSEVALRIYSAFLIGTLYVHPAHSMLQNCVQRIDAMLADDLEINQKVMAGTFLLPYCVYHGDMALGSRTMARIHPLMDKPGLTALNQVWWRLRLGNYFLWTMRYDEADRVLAEAREIAESNGLRSGEGFGCLHEMLAAAARDDVEAVRRVVTRAEANLNPARRSDQIYSLVVRSHLAVMQGDSELALERLEMAKESSANLGFPIKHVVMLHHLMALIEVKQYDKAQHCLDNLRRLVEGTGLRFWECEVRLMEAGLALCSGDLAGCHAALRACLPFYRRCGSFGYGYRCMPNLLPDLLSEALQAEIEVAYVQTLIKHHHIVPKSPEVENWPWPIKIYTLGRFNVVKDGEPVTFTGKAQKKPLDLLKVLIALGGRNVDFTALMGILWPDATGDAQKAFEMALSRLRKLLGQSDVILIQDGKLTLNPLLAWVDAWAFERLLPRADDQITSGGDNADVERADRARGAFDLYRGRFLEREPKAPWIQAKADRLHAKFLRLVLSIGQSQEETSWDQAARVYERGLELDNLVEELYRRLMICHRQRGQLADAMNVYRRCRENLSIILGVAPAADTVAIYNSIRQQ
jgi:LuxR family transcriptional regulator, maltose regulon positive regulatory protein